MSSRRATAVAINWGIKSQHATKWAVDHLVLRHNLHDPRVILIHVLNKNANISLPRGSSMSKEANREEIIEAEMHKLYLPLRGFCARRGIAVEEVVLEDADISKAIVEYINSNRIDNIFVGGSHPTAINAFIWKFKNKPDVPTLLNKNAPEFCAVYVIDKGKVINFRSANRVVPEPEADDEVMLDLVAHEVSASEDSTGHSSLQSTAKINALKKELQETQEYRVALRAKISEREKVMKEILAATDIMVRRLEQQLLDLTQNLIVPLPISTSGAEDHLGTEHSSN